MTRATAVMKTCPLRTTWMTRATTPNLGGVCVCVMIRRFIFWRIIIIIIIDIIDVLHAGKVRSRDVELLRGRERRRRKQLEERKTRKRRRWRRKEWRWRTWSRRLERGRSHPGSESRFSDDLQNILRWCGQCVRLIKYVTGFRHPVRQIHTHQSSWRRLASPPYE